MSRYLVIGATGLLGSAVVKALGEQNCIRASRSSPETVDISDPASLKALFARIGDLDGIVCASGAARFKPYAQQTDEDWAFSLANKLMGQVNVVRFGANSVKSGGAITLTSGVLAQAPMPGGTIVTPVNAAVEAFVLAASVEPALSQVRVNCVSPGWVAETLHAMGRDPAGGIPAAQVAEAFVRQRDPAGGIPAAQVAEAFVRQQREGVSGAVLLSASE